MQKTYEVKIYYSTFYTQEVKAESAENAIEKAAKTSWQAHPDAKIELLDNLDRWPEANEAELV